MTGNIHMPNLNFILQEIFDIFSRKCNDDAVLICDSSLLTDTKLLQP